MKFTLSWLKDHLETSASIQEVAEAMTMAGLEVEEVSDSASALAPFTVAKIVEAARHPNADRLQVCQVDTVDGRKEIVCGAPNARAGLTTIYAPIGAYVPGLGVTLVEKPVRGVVSNGMLCSAKTAVPALSNALGVLLGLGHTVGGPSGEFIISPDGHAKLWPHLPYEPTRIVFGYAENPDSLESLTAKAAWLDGCGQKQFKRESHEAIQARLAVNEGRIIYTSTPYVHHWLKDEVHDRAVRYKEAIKANLPYNAVDADYESISFESRQNPAFPEKEWDRQKAILPPWRFDMRYRGLFTRPAGAIYDCFDPDFHILPGKDFELPANWPLYCGIDFGAPNMAATFFYENCEELPGPTKDKPILKKTGKYVAFAEYRPKRVA